MLSRAVQRSFSHWCAMSCGMGPLQCCIYGARKRMHAVRQAASRPACTLFKFSSNAPPSPAAHPVCDSPRSHLTLDMLLNSTVGCRGFYLASAPGRSGPPIQSYKAAMLRLLERAKARPGLGGLAVGGDLGARARHLCAAAGAAQEDPPRVLRPARTPG